MTRLFEANGMRFYRVEGMDLVELGAFSSLDVEMAYRLRQVTLRAGVTNLLDANYERVGGYTEAGRSAYLRAS